MPALRRSLPGVATAGIPGTTVSRSTFTRKRWDSPVGMQVLPRENRYCESFNSKLSDGLMNAELFSTLYEAEVLIESWRHHDNAIRPHSPLGYRPAAPEAILPRARGLPYASLRSAHGLAATAGFELSGWCRCWGQASIPR